MERSLRRIDRLTVANLLVFAVLASAMALAYYGWSYTAEQSSRERALVADTMGDLADEKIIGIETALVETDEQVFAAIRPDDPNPQRVQDVIRQAQAPVLSVFLLDARLQELPSGYFSARVGVEAQTEFRRFFTERVLPGLALQRLQVGARGHAHGVWDGRELLFSFSRRVAHGRDHFVVLEIDLKYVVGSVFPGFLQIRSERSPRLYQVVDERGELIYGTPFRTDGPVVERRFADTVDRWRLRVAQRDATAGSQQRRKLIDLVLIGVALGGIVAGLGVLLAAMRRERRANELKSDFISNVSHELKTPLSIISMFGEMLALGRVRGAEQATEYAEIIWRESVRLARLIDNVLDFSKIERGKEVYEFAEGDVAEVVARAVELSMHRLQKAELVVEVDLAEQLPPVRVDASALTLAVTNLIDNAIKYAAEGRRLVVRVFQEGDRIVLEVQDFGRGIAPSEHDRIFERFYRARAIRLQPIRGSGIGLALVEHIVLAHGGEVAVRSAPGQGATFVISLPIPPGAGGADRRGMNRPFEVSP